MTTLHQTLLEVAGAWGLVTVILIVALIYRSTLENREEDQIYLDPAEKALANEQRAVVRRVEQLTWPIRALFAGSGMLLLTAVALWLWEGLNS